MSLLVFTDLDGSLMEHESYSIKPAEKALAVLARKNIPLVMNSSKTAAEIEALQKMMAMPGAYICENGAALKLPEQAEPLKFGQPRMLWLEKVHEFRSQEGFKFQGFSDWSASDIAELTGLDQKSAELSKQREFSEPILWRDSANAKRKFVEQLSSLGLKLLEGGRFVSIQSAFDKSNGMMWLKSQQNPTLTIALGDSPNDEAMLNCADIAVVIKSAKSERIKLTGAQKVIRTKRPGPAGWQDAMLEILQQYEGDS
ncbi:MAG: HAD-IIB family hydrolase [Pseudohongiellaceae bacterium]